MLSWRTVGNWRKGGNERFGGGTKGLTRKELIGTGRGSRRDGAAGAGDGGSSGRSPPPRDKRNVAGMNIILFISDQERAIQHFPKTGCARTFLGCGGCGVTGSASNAPSPVPACAHPPGRR